MGIYWYFMNEPLLSEHDFQRLSKGVTYTLLEVFSISKNYMQQKL